MTEADLIAAIHDAPRSDAPRLAYAYWCGSNGLQDLAEFIHIQCQKPYFGLCPPPGAVLSSWLGEKIDDPARVARAAELLDGLYGTERFPHTQMAANYYRGVPVYEYTVGRENREINANELLDSPLARLWLNIHDGDAAWWVENPIMRYVDFLAITPDYDGLTKQMCDVTADDVRSLLNSPVIDRLSGLRLYAGMTEEAAAIVSELKKRVPVRLYA